jgi:hypothetical protein
LSWSWSYAAPYVVRLRRHTPQNRRPHARPFPKIGRRTPAFPKIDRRTPPHRTLAKQIRRSAISSSSSIPSLTPFPDELHGHLRWRLLAKQLRWVGPLLLGRHESTRSIDRDQRKRNMDDGLLADWASAAAATGPSRWQAHTDLTFLRYQATSSPRPGQEAAGPGHCSSRTRGSDAGAGQGRLGGLRCWEN